MHIRTCTGTCTGHGMACEIVNVRWVSIKHIESGFLRGTGKVGRYVCGLVCVAHCERLLACFVFIGKGYCCMWQKLWQGL